MIDGVEPRIVKTFKGEEVKVYRLGEYYFPEHKIYTPWFSPDYIDYIAKQFTEMLKYKWSCEVLITGIRRSGKSNLAQQIARKIDPKFPQEDVVFTVEEFTERYLAHPPADPEKGYYPQIIIDEAGYELFSQQWYERIQKEMVRLFEVSAAKYHIIYLIAPNLGLINKHFRAFGQYWIHLTTDRLERGTAEFWHVKPNKFQAEPYYEAKSAFVFDPLEDDFWQEYEKRKKEFIRQAISTFGDHPRSNYPRYCKTLIKHLMTKYHYTEVEIGRMLDISHQAVSYILRKQT